MDKRIEPLKNGPYFVEGFDRISDGRKGELELEPGGSMLCRCGKSKRMPFCDASHVAAGFTDDDAKDWKPGRRKAYEGEGITIFSNQRICAHVGVCLRNLPSVFNLDMEPWIDPVGAGAEEIIDTIRACPSGSLSYATESGREDTYAIGDSISAWKDGPFVVMGDVTLAADQMPEAADHYTLCRCGKSMNKPFCDGNHIDTGFTDKED